MTDKERQLVVSAWSKAELGGMCEPKEESGEMTVAISVEMAIPEEVVARYIGDKSVMQRIEVSSGSGSIGSWGQGLERTVS